MNRPAASPRSTAAETGMARQAATAANPKMRAYMGFVLLGQAQWCVLTPMKECAGGAGLVDHEPAGSVAEVHSGGDRHGKASGNSRQSEDARIHGFCPSGAGAVVRPHSNERMRGGSRPG